MLLHSPPEPLRARVTAYEGTLEAVSDDRCILQTGAHSLDALAVFVAAMGVDFQILEPPELVTHARDVGRRLSRAARAAAPERKPRRGAIS